ncbi:MAG: terminase small subunit [Phage AS32]|nr:MAG: terminase small subunit [Phage AS32]
MFGMGFACADVDPRTSAQSGKVNLPNGKELAYARTVGQLQWVNMMGMSVTDLKEPKQRCIYNIKAANWAGEHFEESVRFKSKGSSNPDPNSPRTVLPVVQSGFKANPSIEAQEGDKVVCDSCSLSSTCKEYREGAVCSIRDSETNILAKMFQSRSSDKIIDGLGAILGAQAKRLERGMMSEEEFGELDPEVTKIMNQLFANGVKFAKLVDPTLNKPLVQINGVGSAGVAGSSPKELGAAVVRELEAKGIAREDITPAMFEAMLLEMTGGPKQEQPEAIEGSPHNG